jgi:RNA recognition motif-containing protein
MLKRDTTNTQHLQQQQQQQQGRESLVGRQLYVGNIPTNVGWKEIKDLMRQAGNVIRVNILTNDEKQPHAIVLFSTLKDAQKAIGVFNGYKWSGNQLVVREDTSLYGIVMNKNVDESNSFAGSHDVTESSSEYQSHQLTGQNQGQNDDQTGNRKQVFVCNVYFYQ